MMLEYHVEPQTVRKSKDMYADHHRKGGAERNSKLSAGTLKMYSQIFGLNSV